MLTGKGLAQFAQKNLGVPYFYGAKMQVLTENFMNTMHQMYPSTVTKAYMEKARNKKMLGKVCVDCSGLIASYRGKNMSSAKLYSTAHKRLKMSQITSFPVGTVLWKQGHVGVLVENDGLLMCVEAKGIDYGVVKTKVADTKWEYGLLFDDMIYELDDFSPIEKIQNPFREPTRNLKQGCIGDDVKWLQWELIESGYNIDCDGAFGYYTAQALKAFQQSVKISADKICGPVTREKLKEA